MCLIQRHGYWIPDVVHTFAHVSGLKDSRTLAHDEVDLRVKNGASVVALAVGTYLLTLHSGLVLELENCFHVSAMSRNIISISCLDKK